MACRGKVSFNLGTNRYRQKEFERGIDSAQVMIDGATAPTGLVPPAAYNIETTPGGLF